MLLECESGSILMLHPGSKGRGGISVSLRAPAFNRCARGSVKREVPDFLVRSTGLFSLRLPSLKVATVNTIDIQRESIKILPVFVRSAKKYNV